jgi:cell division protein ZapA
MPEVAINLGDKKFTVTCQPGEESALESAASLLNEEASYLVSEIGQLSEQKLLLMSGLMLADKMFSQSQKLTKFEAALEEALTKVKELEEVSNPPSNTSGQHDLLKQLSVITEKAEKIALKMTN